MKAVTRVFEHPRNFRQKIDAEKCRLKLTVVTKGSKLSIVQGGPKKPGQFFRLDNFVMVSPRKARSASKFSKFYREKGTKLAFQ